jgi:hypothetical protein
VIERRSGVEHVSLTQVMVHPTELDRALGETESVEARERRSAEVRGVTIHRPAEVALVATRPESLPRTRSGEGR